MLKIYKLLVCFIFILIPRLVSAQLCGGSFGNPIFTEDFGGVNTSSQIISGPLLPPAFTNYTYYRGYPPNDGFYTITNYSGENGGWGWHKSYDHTNDASGTYGNMLVVNASYTAGEFYRRRVTGLCSNQVFRFSAWIMNLSTPSSHIKPNVTMEIRSISGVVLGSVSTGDLPVENRANWKIFFLDFRAEASSSDVDVVMINNAPGGIGNDLAIDDITFSPCGPATTIKSNIANIITSGVCDNSQDLSLTAQINSNPYQNINYIWQRSTDNGVTWNSLTLASSNTTLDIPAGTYQNNYQYRFIVGEGANIGLSNCQVISAPTILKINGYPNPPVVQNFSFCQNSIPSPISANGTNLIWYNSSVGGVGSTIAPTPDTSRVGTFSYWVSQTINGCESPRERVDVVINAVTVPPTVPQNFVFCQNSPSSSLYATGTNLLWYDAITGGVGKSVAPNPDTSQVGTFSYWVSQTINGCESARKRIDVIVNAVPNPPIVTGNFVFCQNSVTKSLTATGINLLWYNSSSGGLGSTIAPIPDTSQVGTFSYWVTQSINGCESARKRIDVIVNTLPNPPTVQNFSFCQNSVPTPISASGSNLLWYKSSTGGIGSETASVPDTSLSGTFTYYVSQKIDGCESERAKVEIIIKPNPSKPTVVSGIILCQNSSASPLNAEGTNLLWYSSATGGGGNVQAPIPNTLKIGDFSFWVSQTVNGCESAREEIKVKILPAPFSSTLQDINICDGETKTLDAGPGFEKYVWNTVPVQYSQSIAVSKTGDYSVTITDNKGCSTTQTVKVNAGTTPVITQVFSTESSIKILATSGGNPPYFYSINGKDWQTENIFENLKPAVYTIYVKSQTNSCTAVAKTAVIDIPNVITPDRNGKNDVFKIKYINYFPESFLKIFDRFGKMVFKSENSILDWDGTYNGRTVHTGTYWYHLNLGNGYEKTGWILVKNIE